MPAAPESASLAGKPLGHFEVLGLLGRGGMGEVYQARDVRLGRIVALKVLPPEALAEPARRERFLREARAASALNHPGIVTVHEVGHDQGVDFIAMEKVEGRPLHIVVPRDGLPSDVVLDYALQIADAAAAAHDGGVIHRDLTPRNVMVMDDERIKVLDFGLAKLAADGRPLGAADSTAAMTVGGAPLGTPAYMSPEQAQGLPVDARTDVFSFGCLLYFMLSGRSPFERENAALSLGALLRDAPPAVTARDARAAGLMSIALKCLEKDAAYRYPGMRDLLVDLRRQRRDPGERAPAAQLRARGRLRYLALALAAALAASAGTLWLGRRPARHAPASFHRLTFRHGRIGTARYAPDGQTIVYGAAWAGQPIEVFSARAGNPEARSLAPNSDLFAVSRSGDIALALGRRHTGIFEYEGTLARAPLAGGTPKEIAEHVRDADWTPDGQGIALIRKAEGRDRLEFPSGTVLAQSSGWLSHLRISPRGDRIAYLDHPVPGDDGGSVAVVDLAGHKTTLAAGFWGTQGLAWSPRGDEIWFTATRKGEGHALRAVSLSGQQRVLQPIAGWPSRLLDVAADGRVLLSVDDLRGGLVGHLPGQPAARDLAWLEASLVTDLSADGSAVLFAEAGEGGGVASAAYLRKTDGSPAVRLGDGLPMALSPDGRWALTAIHAPRLELFLLPTGQGDKRVIPVPGLDDIQAGGWLPDGRGLVLLATQPGHASRLFLVDAAGGTPAPVSGEGLSSGLLATNTIAISPDGRRVAAVGADQQLAVFPLDGGDPRPIPGLAPGLAPIRWAGSRELYVYRYGESPEHVDRVDVETGRTTTWKELDAPIEAFSVFPIQISADGRWYAYSYANLRSDLYEIDGLE